MRTGRGLLAIAAMTALAACATTPEVRSTRADPTGSATPPSSDPVTSPTDSTPPSDSSSTTPASSTDSLDWGPCDDPNARDPVLECATLSVPLDYNDPTGADIELALIKVPAVDDRAGALLFNPGGPGASGFDFIAFSGSGLTSLLGISAFDLIGFDPRGVDRSDGIRCVSDEFLTQHLYIDETPDAPADQALKDESYSGFIDGCKQKYGDTLRFYSTENAARDIDAIRAAVGDEQISYLGVSYGTFLGATYATMYPDRVRAMVLDSVEEPNGDTDEQQFATQLVGFEGAFDNWAAWCEGEATCRFAAPDVGGRWDALRQQLDDEPLAIADGRLVNNATMLRATQAALYSESQWPVLADALADAEAGDGVGMLAMADSFNGRSQDGTFNTLFQSFPVIQCASGLAPRRPADPETLATTLRAAAPRFAKYVTADDLTSDADRCDQLVGDVEPGEVSYDGDGPIVLVGGTNDPATPIRWTQKMLAEMGPNARMVTYTGEGHGQLLSSTCVAEIEGALLANLTLPDSDTVCDVAPIVNKPDWWDALPVPDEMSDVVGLPAVAAVLGAAPTQFFSEMRTTTLDPEAAVAAYTNVLAEDGLQQFDAPALLPLDDIAQGAYTDGLNRTMAVLALGPKAFDDAALQGAKVEVPPNTTVVWLVAIDI
ncbi:MAG: alpha/beta fold hydrolase [Ilumatobacteraceae bacterium]